MKAGLRKLVDFQDGDSRRAALQDALKQHHVLWDTQFIVDGDRTRFFVFSKNLCLANTILEAINSQALAESEGAFDA